MWKSGDAATHRFALFDMGSDQWVGYPQTGKIENVCCAGVTPGIKFWKRSHTWFSGWKHFLALLYALHYVRFRSLRDLISNCCYSLYSCHTRETSSTAQRTPHQLQEFTVRRTQPTPPANILSAVSAKQLLGSRISVSIVRLATAEGRHESQWCLMLDYRNGWLISKTTRSFLCYQMVFCLRFYLCYLLFVKTKSLRRKFNLYGVVCHSRPVIIYSGFLKQISSFSFVVRAVLQNMGS